LQKQNKTTQRKKMANNYAEIKTLEDVKSPQDQVKLFNTIYVDLMNKYNNDQLDEEKIKSLNLDKYNFLDYQKKFIEGILNILDEKREEAFCCFQESNEIEKNGYAMTELGNCYYLGLGVEKDEKMGIYFWNTAIEYENGFAMYNLGKCYDYGRHIEKDEDKAIELYKLALEKGCLSVVNEMDFYIIKYSHDEEICKEVVKFLKMAIEKGSVDAIYVLAKYHYKDGNCVEAIRLYKIFTENDEQIKENSGVLQDILSCYGYLSYKERYEFYKTLSISVNSLILEKITKKKENECLHFEILKMQEHIVLLENKIADFTK